MLKSLVLFPTLPLICQCVVILAGDGVNSLQNSHFEYLFKSLLFHPSSLATYSIIVLFHYEIIRFRFPNKLRIMEINS